MIIADFPFFLVSALPIWAVYRASIFLKNRKLNPWREIMMNIFFIYILAVVYVTFFPVEFRLYDWSPSVNIIPIKKSISLLKYGTVFSSFKNIAGNILLLIPVGIFLPLLFSRTRSMKRVMLAGILISVSIEVTQLMTAIRICDIDDVIFNTLGSVLGYLAYKIMGRNIKMFRLIQSSVESDTHRNLFILASKPVILMVLITVPVFLTSFYQNTYSLLESYSYDQTIYQDGQGQKRDDKTERIFTSDGYTVVLSTANNIDGGEEIDVKIYRNVLFNRVAYLGESHLKMDGNQKNAYTTYGILADRDTILNVVYGKNTGNMASVIEVTRGNETLSQSLTDHDYFVTLSTMRELNRRMVVKLFDSNGNNVTDKFYNKNAAPK